LKGVIREKEIEVEELESDLKVKVAHIKSLGAKLLES